MSRSVKKGAKAILFKDPFLDVKIWGTVLDRQYTIMKDVPVLTISNTCSSINEHLRSVGYKNLLSMTVGYDRTVRVHNNDPGAYSFEIRNERHTLPFICLAVGYGLPIRSLTLSLNPTLPEGVVISVHENNARNVIGDHLLKTLSGGLLLADVIDNHIIKDSRKPHLSLITANFTFIREHLVSQTTNQSTFSQSRSP
jgi:hypothetical protein